MRAVGGGELVDVGLAAQPVMPRFGVAGSMIAPSAVGRKIATVDEDQTPGLARPV